jgi:hypothetical protein
MLNENTAGNKRRLTFMVTGVLALKVSHLLQNASGFVAGSVNLLYLEV